MFLHNNNCSNGNNSNMNMLTHQPPHPQHLHHSYQHNLSHYNHIPQQQHNNYHVVSSSSSSSTSTQSSIQHQQQQQQQQQVYFHPHHHPIPHHHHHHPSSLHPPPPPPLHHPPPHPHIPHQIHHQQQHHHPIVHTYHHPQQQQQQQHTVSQYQQSYVVEGVESHHHHHHHHPHQVMMNNNNHHSSTSNGNYSNSFKTFHRDSAILPSIINQLSSTLSSSSSSSSSTDSSSSSSPSVSMMMMTTMNNDVQQHNMNSSSHSMNTGAGAGSNSSNGTIGSSSNTKITGQQIAVGNDGPYGVFMNRSGVIKLKSNQFDDIVVHHTNTIDNSTTFQSNGKDRYKTEMCRSWDEYGYCRYGDKCQFAHGEHELREVTRHHKYKSELCNNYHYEGTCMYGIRCCFIHKVSPEDIGRALSQNIDVVSLRNLSKRLAVFESVCPICMGFKRDSPVNLFADMEFDSGEMLQTEGQNSPSQDSAFGLISNDNGINHHHPNNHILNELNGNSRVVPVLTAAQEYLEPNYPTMKMFAPSSQQPQTQYYLYPEMHNNQMQHQPTYHPFAIPSEPILN